MKSPALGDALAPLKALQAKAFEEYEQARKDFEISERAGKLRAEARKIAARKALNDSPSANVAAILAPDAEPEEPRARRYVVNDSTVEALAEILEENANGVLLERDELIGWLRDLEREGRQSDRAFYLTAADGDKPFTVDRILRGKGRHVEALCVAILGGIQPDVLAEFVRDTQRGAGGEGLLQRFGLMVYPDIAPWRNVDRLPDAEARDAVRRLVERLIGLDGAAIAATRDEYRGLWFLPFAEPAQALFDKWFAELEGRLRDADEHPAMTAHLAKYRKLVPALALIGHLAECDGGPVSEPALARALALAEYLEGHARRVYAVAIRPELDAARSLLAKLRTGRLAIEVRPRDVYRKGWAGLATPDQVSAALRVLAEFEWLRERHEETGGRPSLVYRAHPAAKGSG
jgi:putative DNA primase/helicase